MGKLTFIRHDTPSDATIILGQKDVSIVNLRHGRSIKPIVPSSIIYCSPLKRCRQTSILLGYDLTKVIFDDRLKEMDLGAFAGLPANSENLSKIRNLAEDPDSDHHGGESFSQFMYRITDFFEELMSQHPNDDVVIITHSGVIRALFVEYLKIMNTNYQPNYLEMIQYTPGSTEITSKQVMITL